MDERDLLDDLLEASVVGSFTRIGPAVRRRLDGWTEPPSDALVGRTALVTGPTSGLGRVTAERLAGLGARVVLVGRDPGKLTALQAELIERHGEDRFPIVVADLGSLASVREAVTSILATEPRLDVLVDNAGAIHPERHLGPDGIEATFALLVVGPFALEAGLRPILEATAGARVIAVTSGGMYTQAVDLADLESSRSAFSGPRFYARAKRAQTALMREWARRSVARGISYTAMHPGWADTPGLAATLPGFHGLMGPLLRTPAEGADTIVWLAAAPDPMGRTGRLFLDRRPRPFDRIPATRLAAVDRRALWDRVVELAGVPDPAPEPGRFATLGRGRRTRAAAGDRARDDRGSVHDPRRQDERRRATEVAGRRLATHGHQRDAGIGERSGDLGGGLAVRGGHHAEDGGPGLRAGHGLEPAVHAHVRPEIEDADAPATDRRGKREGAELVPCAGRQAHHDDDPTGHSPGLEDGGETPAHRGARRMLGGDADAPGRPRLPQPCRGGQQQVVHDGLK